MTQTPALSGQVTVAPPIFEAQSRLTFLRGRRTGSWELKDPSASVIGIFLTLLNGFPITFL